jgi:PAS domain-containing protein
MLDLPAQHQHAAPDFRAVFNAIPTPCLLLAPDLTIVDMNDAYAKATMTAHEQIIGRPMFEVFPDNPEDPTATGVANLRASLMRVLQNKTADTMAVQKYDIARPEAADGGFEERYWSPINTPVLNAQGELTHILHRVEDVTAFIKSQTRAAEMESEIAFQASEIQAANRRLREANEDLDRRI